MIRAKIETRRKPKPAAITTNRLPATFSGDGRLPLTHHLTERTRGSDHHPAQDDARQSGERVERNRHNVLVERRSCKRPMSVGGYPGWWWPVEGYILLDVSAIHGLQPEPGHTAALVGHPQADGNPVGHHIVMSQMAPPPAPRVTPGGA